MMASDAFSFRGKLLDFPPLGGSVVVAGPWHLGRQTFWRKKSDTPTSLLTRIELSAGKAEVVRAHVPCLLVCPCAQVCVPPDPGRS